MRKIKAADIVQDLTIYPRCAVDKGHVQTLVHVLEAGGELPPLVICSQTRKLVDGFHRLNANLQAFGSECEVEVIEKEYATAAEMWLDSIRYNAKHGLPFSGADREHCKLTCKRIGVDGTSVALALGVRESALGILTVVNKTSPALSTVRKPFQRHDGQPKQYDALANRSLRDVAGENIAGAGRCHLCGTKLIPGEECVACNLAHPKKLSVMEREEAEYERFVLLDEEQELPEGWEERLAQIRHAKQSGDEMGFHVQWLIDRFDRGQVEWTENLHAQLERLQLLVRDALDIHQEEVVA